jgi:hypothetical protein
MPNSPLDGSFESSKKRLKPKWVLALIALIATGVGGGVFAVTITVNSDENVEFGQGFASLTACDDQVTLTPTSVFDGTDFILETIEVSGLNTTSTDADSGVGCGTKTLIVKAYAAGTAVAAEASYSVPAVAETDATVVLTPAPSATAGEILKITIESQ